MQQQATNGTHKKVIEQTIAKCLKAEGQPFGISELLDFSQSGNAITGIFESTDGRSIQFELSTILRFD